MVDSTDIDREKALDAIADMIERSEKVQIKFAIGTSQHTLQQNRIAALKIASVLISGESEENGSFCEFARADLEKARAPILSLISKSEKA